MTTLGELEKLLKAGTPGPWEVVKSPSGLWAVINDPFNQNIASLVDNTPAIEPADAALIVAAINALPGLLESARRVERLEAGLQAIVDNAAIDTDAVLFRAQSAAFARTLLKGT